MSGDTPAAGQVSCSMSTALLQRVRTTAGEDALRAVIALAGVQRPPGYLETLGNWIDHDEATALFEAAVQVTADPDIARKVGQDAVRRHAGTPVASMFRALGSPEALFTQLSAAVTKFSTVTDMSADAVAPGAATVVAQARSGLGRHPQLCLWTQGLLSQPTVLFGLPPAEVRHTVCQAHGAPRCEYEISWDAERAAGAGDPEQLITALELQLAAVSERLSGIYATARDLISIDELDEALQRITERAATLVRAPQYVLAVRAGKHDRLRVHHQGLNDAEAHQLAHRLLDDEDAPRPANQLTAEVASGTRRYGRLMAASPAGGFFEHEQELLQVYARYAAAVLDQHAALNAAREREQQAQALLQLARELSCAVTREQVARRLADATPKVVDCDRAVVFLAEDDGVLHFAAMTATTEGLAEPPQALPLDLADGSPKRFDATTTHPELSEALHRTGATALIVMPIATHGRVYGSVNVTVYDDPDRLTLDSDLLEALSGITAHAATALDNARLIESLAHQARHDSLTGLPGHRAFHEALTATPIPVALATVDIDDFKHVNDTYGHPVGDDALRKVAEALEGAVRSDDIVFRTGGEEFCVILPGLDARRARPVAERLRDAVRAIDFHVPLRVSVGLASGAHEDLVERADAALYIAKRAGKDRVALAGE
jgi:diguanylate cyclase (GGDEF)-like protein